MFQTELVAISSLGDQVITLEDPQELQENREITVADKQTISTVAKDLGSILPQDELKAIAQHSLREIASSLREDSEITSITEAINNTGSGTIGLTQAVESFTLHTNTLSGLIGPSTTNPTPSLERVLSVGRSLNNLNYALNSAEQCFSFLNNMTGLFSTETMNGYIGQIAGLIESVNSCLLSASQIIAQINQIATTIQSIVDADNAFFAQALERLKQYALHLFWIVFTVILVVDF